MYHQHAHAVREPFTWHGELLGRGHALTDDDVHELELPENADLLRRCTRVAREALVPADEPVIAAPAPMRSYAPPPAPVSAAAPEEK